MARTATALAGKGGLAEKLAQRPEELGPEQKRRLMHFKGRLGKLPKERPALIEKHDYRRDRIEKQEDLGQSVSTTYKRLQRTRQILQKCMENAVEPDRAMP